MHIKLFKLEINNGFFVSNIKLPHLTTVGYVSMVIVCTGDHAALKAINDIMADIFVTIC